MFANEALNGIELFLGVNLPAFEEQLATKKLTAQ